MPRSVRIRASTGNAVMLIDAPMNKANGVNRPVAEPRVGNSVRASSDPSRKGTTMLTWLTVAAIRPRRLGRVQMRPGVENQPQDEDADRGHAGVAEDGPDAAGRARRPVRRGCGLHLVAVPG